MVLHACCMFFAYNKTLPWWTPSMQKLACNTQHVAQLLDNQLTLVSATCALDCTYFAEPEVMLTYFCRCTASMHQLSLFAAAVAPLPVQAQCMMVMRALQLATC